MRRAICIIVTVVALAAGAAYAQAPMMPKGKWWRMPEVAKQLQLTSEQQTKLDAVFNLNSTELIDLKADVDKLGIELRAQLEKSQTAKKDVLGVAQSLGVARGKLFEREIVMMVDMKAILTPEQWDALRLKLEERAGRMRESGPMGPRPNRPNRNPR